MIAPGELGRASLRHASDIPKGGVLYYALGGGIGHLTRGLAIARHFRRLRPEPFLILTNCQVDLPDPVEILRMEGRPDGPALAELIGDLIDNVRPAVLAVDAFPAGILGELTAVLAHLDCRRAAVLRLLQPHWVDRWHLPELLAEAFDAAALVEPGARFPGFPSALLAVETPPVLIRDADELLAPEAARRRLGHEGPEPLVLVSTTGTRLAERALPDLARRVVAEVSHGGAALRVASPRPEIAAANDCFFHFPLLECLPGADLVIGACGYNLCHEVAAVGVPAVFVPRPRLYDDQFGRAAGLITAGSPEELEARVRDTLASLPSTRAAPSYENGAAAVARLLADLAE